MLIMGCGILSLAFLKQDQANPSWKYCTAIFLIYSVGYPIGHTAVIGLFSKVVGRRPQGTLQGWFASAGSLARIIFPVISGYISEYDDITTMFILLFVILVTSNVFVALSAKTLTTLSQ